MPSAPADIDLDDLEGSVTDGQAARLAISNCRQLIRHHEVSEEDARDVLRDAVAVAARYMSFGDIQDFTGLDRGYLHRMAKSSDLYHRNSDT